MRVIQSKEEHEQNKKVYLIFVSKCRKKNISLNWSKSGYLELKVWLPRMEHLEEQFSESLSIS